MNLDDIASKVREHQISLVELTGGEPLAQENCAPLAQLFISAGHKVLIETGGSEDISVLPKEVHVIMDIKCPGSQMHERNLWKNLDHLKSTDEIKMVLAHKDDYNWAKEIMKAHRLTERFKVLLSPAFGLLKPQDLAEWIVQDKLNVRLNLQQHKYIWHPRAKGV
jgi:7-carboxy-7-deazaguanine synthase